MSIFEITMLVCFGLAWPVSVYKSIKSKSTKGKSFIFLLVVFIGYIAGTLHKIFYNFDLVIILYIINGIMVLLDMILFLINKYHFEVNDAC